MSLASYNKLLPGCRECGACCTGSAIMALADEEAERYRAANPTLQLHEADVSDPPVPAGRQWWDRDGDCGYATRDPHTNRVTCTIYDDRPASCAEFPEGGEDCRRLQCVRQIISITLYQGYLRRRDAELIAGDHRV